MVELLVVIGIITVLVGLLLPVLNRARQSGEAAKCLSNLHQFAMSAGEYAAVNKGVIAALGYSGVSPFGTAQSITWDAGNPPGSTTGQDPRYGLWGQYGLNANRLLVCPTLVTSGLIADANEPYVPSTGQFFRSYGWNFLQYCFGATSLNLSRVRQPTQTVLITDIYTLTGGTMIGNGAVYSQHPSNATSSTSARNPPNLPVFHGRHTGKGGVLWIDGHATMEPAIYPPSSTVIQVNISPATYPEPMMQNLHIGFLCRSAAELNSSKPIMDYYYLINKDVASGSDFTAYDNPSAMR